MATYDQLAQLDAGENIRKVNARCQNPNGREGSACASYLSVGPLSAGTESKHLSGPIEWSSTRGDDSRARRRRILGKVPGEFPSHRFAGDLPWLYAAHKRRHVCSTAPPFRMFCLSTRAPPRGRHHRGAFTRRLRTATKIQKTRAVISMKCSAREPIF